MPVIPVQGAEHVLIKQDTDLCKLMHFISINFLGYSALSKMEACQCKTTVQF